MKRGSLNTTAKFLYADEGAEITQHDFCNANEIAQNLIQKLVARKSLLNVVLCDSGFSQATASLTSFATITYLNVNITRCTDLHITDIYVVGKLHRW